MIPNDDAMRRIFTLSMLKWDIFGYLVMSSFDSVDWSQVLKKEA